MFSSLGFPEYPLQQPHAKYCPDLWEAPTLTCSGEGTCHQMRPTKRKDFFGLCLSPNVSSARSVHRMWLALCFSLPYLPHHDLVLGKIKWIYSKGAGCPGWARRGQCKVPALGLPPVQWLTLTHCLAWAAIIIIVIIIAITIIAELIVLSRATGSSVLAVCSYVGNDGCSKYQPVLCAKHTEGTLFSGKVKFMGSHESRHPKSLQTSQPEYEASF